MFLIVFIGGDAAKRRARKPATTSSPVSSSPGLGANKYANMTMKLFGKKKGSHGADDNLSEPSSVRIGPCAH